MFYKFWSLCFTDSPFPSNKGHAGDLSDCSNGWNNSIGVTDLWDYSSERCLRDQLFHYTVEETVRRVEMTTVGLLCDWVILVFEKKIQLFKNRQTNSSMATSWTEGIHLRDDRF